MGQFFFLDGMTNVLPSRRLSIYGAAFVPIASSIVFFLIKYTVGLKSSPEAEEEGLDIVEHGERAYHY